MSEPHPTALAAMREALPLIEQGKIQQAIDVVEPFQPGYIVDCLDTLSEDERSPDEETIENHRQFIVQWVDRIVARESYGSSAALGLDLVSRLHSQYRTHLTYFPDIEWYSRDACLYGAALAQ